MTSFHAEGIVCEAGGAQNEDAVQLEAEFIVVVDGATSLSPGSLMGWPSDAQWFSHRLLALICTQLTDKSAGIPSAVRQALYELRLEADGKFGSTSGGPTSARSPAMLPSASVAIARLTSSHVEVFSLGDCTTLVGLRSGAVESIHDATLTRLDGIAIARMVDFAHSHGVSVRAARDSVDETLRNHRMLMNQEDLGYWTAELTGMGVDHAVQRRFRNDAVLDVAVMSDGFAAALDVVGLVDGSLSFLAALRNLGAAEVGDQIVAALDSDPDYERFPRLKHRDDMSVVHASVDIDRRSEQGP